MSEEKQKNYHLILSAEDSFAQGVAMNVWVRRPLSAWHCLLPGMFVWDILRRRRAVQQYSALFLFPRKLALDAALQKIEGEDGVEPLSRAEKRVEEWLLAKKVYSPRVLKGHMEQIRLLLEHYGRLLRARGESHPALVRCAYGSRANYQDFLARLAAAEGEVDQGLAEIQGGTPESWARLRTEQAVVSRGRQKEVERIFPEEGEG